MMKPEQVPLHILLAEDDEDNRLLFEEAVDEISAGYHLKTFPDGQKLMTYLSENENHPPDVIFLDLNMPLKNGRECLSEIRQNKKLKSMPVIIHSNSVGPGMADFLYEQGANYILQKVDSFWGLVDGIKEVFLRLTENAKQPI